MQREEHDRLSLPSETVAQTNVTILKGEEHNSGLQEACVFFLKCVYFHDSK